MIKISDLRFAYDKLPVLKNVSLEVARGKIAGIIGPNGSGKTTLLKILSGVLRDFEGSITIDGEDIRKIGRLRLSQKLAVVPQDSEIVFPFTCLDVILMGRAPYLRNFSFESADDLMIARRAMEMTDTLPFAHRYIQDLSGGERQRVIIARAIAQSTKILLLDEPTTHLDIKHQLTILSLVRRLSEEEGLTILITLHDINHATMLCDSVIALKEGKIAAQGRPGAILNSDAIREIFEVDIKPVKDGSKTYYIPKI